ncbi:MAG: hypothetical protein QXW02_00520 [Nitrososphaerota archaeon]
MRAEFAAAAIILALMLLTTAFPAISAEKQVPTIEVYKLTSFSTTMRVYVHPQDIDINTGEKFSCPARDKAVSAFYATLTALRKSMLRFSDEYPQYAALASLIFMNASREEEADIILVIVRGLNLSRAVLYKAIDPRRANEVQILCDEAREFNLEQLRGS